MINRHVNGTRFKRGYQSAPVKHLSISNLALDVRQLRIGGRVDSKGSAEIELKVGSLGRHGGLAAKANNIQAGVVGVQARQLCGLCRDLLDSEGIRPYLVPRRANRGAITVATPNGVPGHFDLNVQRMPPLTERELTRIVLASRLTATSVFMGPMQVGAPAACVRLHRKAAGLAARRALMAHTSLLCNRSLFSVVGAMYDYVQMNLKEAALLDSSTDDIDLLACCVRCSLRERVSFAITNGPNRGLFWCAEGREWFVIQPPAVKDVRCDIGCGDVFGAAFNLSRWYFGATVPQALAYASRAVGAWMLGDSIPAF